MYIRTRPYVCTYMYCKYTYTRRLNMAVCSIYSVEELYGVFSTCLLQCGCVGSVQHGALLLADEAPDCREAPSVLSLLLTTSVSWCVLHTYVCIRICTYEHTCIRTCTRTIHTYVQYVRTCMHSVLCLCCFTYCTVCALCCSAHRNTYIIHTYVCTHI